jgi:IS30 family transposase
MAHHLTLEEREVISQMRHAGQQQAQIARQLGRSPSTISRELSRNGSCHRYRAVAAQRMADERRGPRPQKLQQPEVRRYVVQRLRKRWTPDEIAGRSERDCPRQRHRQLSRQTIYTWIHQQDSAGACWGRYLPSAAWKRRDAENRGRIAGCVSIAGRPAVVDHRGRFGDWEGDTLVGAGRHGGAVSLVERKSGYLLRGRAANLQATTVRKVAATLYRQTPPALRKTLTLDNGKEFAEHEQLAAEATLKIYFADPYCAWQRGTNENTNGLIRQFFPKGTDLARIPDHRFTTVQELLNDRPRRRLGYRTPREVLASRRLVAIQT